MLRRRFLATTFCDHTTMGRDDAFVVADLLVAGVEAAAAGDSAAREQLRGDVAELAIQLLGLLAGVISPASGVEPPQPQDDHQQDVACDTVVRLLLTAILGLPAAAGGMPQAAAAAMLDLLQRLTRAAVYGQPGGGRRWGAAVLAFTIAEALLAAPAGDGGGCLMLAAADEPTRAGYVQFLCHTALEFAIRVQLLLPPVERMSVALLLVRQMRLAGAAAPVPELQYGHWQLALTSLYEAAVGLDCPEPSSPAPSVDLLAMPCPAGMLRPWLLDDTLEQQVRPCCFTVDISSSNQQSALISDKLLKPGCGRTDLLQALHLVSLCALSTIAHLAPVLICDCLFAGTGSFLRAGGSRMPNRRCHAGCDKPPWQQEAAAAVNDCGSGRASGSSGAAARPATAAAHWHSGKRAESADSAPGGRHTNVREGGGSPAENR